MTDTRTLRHSRAPALLALADGTLFHGAAIGAAGHTSGELVFNTAMTGYQEILSDPSYSRQIVTLTYPHIGNTGANAEDGESGRVQAAGLVLKNPPLPAQSSAAQALALKPDGIFLSNAPGDPAPCDYAIAASRELIEGGVPTFGICLGHQIMTLASGAKTLKMKLGHHGANHPVQDLDSGQVMITAQNHGFAVAAASLPANCRVTHLSLFDGSLQGFARTDKPAFCFQGHPEAAPGPHDIAVLFERFLGLMETYKNA